MLLLLCREVLKPQPLLAYTDENGGNVMKHCIVGRCAAVALLLPWVDTLPNLSAASCSVSCPAAASVVDELG
jgi:hypothetical protein